MKRRFRNIPIMMLTLSLAVISVFPLRAAEVKALSLISDRSLYVSGETLLFKAYLPSATKSKVLSLDLVANDGKRITGIYKKIQQQEADGYLTLPDSLHTGNYLLCASEVCGERMAFREIFVVNRFKGIATDDRQFAFEAAGTVGRVDPSIDIVLKEPQPNQRQAVGLSVKLEKTLLDSLQGTVQVSIVNASDGWSGACFTSELKGRDNRIDAADGVLLTGTVFERKSSVPVAGAVVFASIPDSVPEFRYFVTGADGRYYFQFRNTYGKVPLVLQSYDPVHARELKLQPDPKADLSTCLPAMKPFVPSAQFAKAAVHAMEASTFRKIFRQEEITVLPPDRKDTNRNYPFYGRPNSVVEPAQFIDLPDFTEISRELLPGVKFRAYNRIPTLQVFNSNLRNYFPETPFLLIDGIPVRDLNLIRNLGTSAISRVEICQSERYYGELRFPGVVAIYTTKRDYAWLTSSDDLLKQNITMLQPPLSVVVPAKAEMTEPDFRQVLLWEPAVKPAANHDFNFQTSDVKGVFRVVVFGKRVDGSMVYQEKYFEVR
ncbi:MAG: hypothetical protein LWW85_13495 [Marinilabiliales bacterium]|nr:hypothetical protein [Marinilabiliales bacterium]